MWGANSYIGRNSRYDIINKQKRLNKRTAVLILITTVLLWLLILKSAGVYFGLIQFALNWFVVREIPKINIYVHPQFVLYTMGVVGVFTLLVAYVSLPWLMLYYSVKSIKILVDKDKGVFMKEYNKKYCEEDLVRLPFNIILPIQKTKWIAGWILAGVISLMVVIPVLFPSIMPYAQSSVYAANIWDAYIFVIVIFFIVTLILNPYAALALTTLFLIFSRDRSKK